MSYFNYVNVSVCVYVYVYVYFRKMKGIVI